MVAFLLLLYRCIVSARDQEVRPGFLFFYIGREREAIDEEIARVDGCKQSYLYSFATRGRSSMCLYGHGLKLGGVSGYRCRKNIAK